MSKSGSPSKSGIGAKAKSPSPITKAVKAITKGVSKGKAPAPKPGFTGATVKSTERLKPATPIIGTRGNQNVNGVSIEKDRMKDRVKKAGLGGL